MQQVTSNHSEISWQDEYRSALKSYHDVAEFFQTPQISNLQFDILLPKSFARKIKEQGLTGPLAKQFLPQEIEKQQVGLIDPIGDKKKSQKGGIIHRYKNRILFTPTTNCPVICRYCFRKNELSNKDEIFKSSLKELKDYLSTHPEVNEVILTGGDPLVLSNQKLAEIFNLISHSQVKFLRIHTRTPIILPKRIDHDFLNLLDSFSNHFQKIIFCLHTNHPSELDEEVKKTLLKLKKLHIDCKTQTVLMKDINNSFETLKKLFNTLLDCGFTPYYLHHPDKVRGAMHFYLELEQGRRIYNQLRNELSGWAIPHYVIDNFQGKGKQLAFNPESFQFSGEMLDINSQLTSY